RRGIVQGVENLDETALLRDEDPAVARELDRGREHEVEKRRRLLKTARQDHGSRGRGQEHASERGGERRHSAAQERGGRGHPGSQKRAAREHCSPERSLTHCDLTPIILPQVMRPKILGFALTLGSECDLLCDVAARTTRRGG